MHVFFLVCILFFYITTMHVFFLVCILFFYITTMHVFFLVCILFFYITTMHVFFLVCIFFYQHIMLIEINQTWIPFVSNASWDSSQRYTNPVKTWKKQLSHVCVQCLWWFELCSLHDHSSFLFGCMWWMFREISKHSKRHMHCCRWVLFF